MSSNDFAIRIQNLSKSFQIYDAPRDRLKQFLAPRLQEMFGKPKKQYFQEFSALKNVSFEVKKGETVGIIGRNGSGKSTLLQIICGTLTPTGGSVETRGRIAALLELGSGFNPEFTGRENIYLNAAVLGLSKEEVDHRFADIIAFADIGDFIEQPVKTYSSGMVVRLAFAVQAIIDPDIFVVDEALAVGDEIFQRKCFARLEELKSRGCAILFVSHSPASIIELCDRTLFLDYGEKLMYCPAPKAIRAYQKLIYAPADEQKQLADEYLLESQSNKDSDNKSKTEPESVSSVHSYDSCDSYDSGLVPETKVIYPIQGAEIKSIRILNTKRRSVNVLQPGATYTFEVSGDFINDFAGIFIGIHIRSISGIVLTGQRYPEEGKFIEDANRGKSFRLSFSFKMDLLPGTYFVGGGIWSSQEPNCAHRFVDAIMFRVAPTRVPISFGYVDLSTKAPNVELF